MGLEQIPVTLLTSKKLLTSLERNDIIPQTIYSDKSPQIEEGIIKIKLIKGLLHLPRLLPFKIPTNSQLDESEIYNILSKKILYDERKGLLRFVDCHKLLQHQIAFDFTFKYWKNIDQNYVDTKIERIERDKSDGKEVTVKNKSEIEIINYLVKLKCPFPNVIISTLENPKKKDMDRYISVFDKNNDEIKVNFGSIYIIGKDIKLFGDVYWNITLEPSEKKFFRIVYTKKIG